MKSNDRIIVVGMGMAAVQFVKQYRSEGGSAEITIITEDTGDVYYRPNLSASFRKGASKSDLLLQTSSAFAEQYGVKVITETKVNSIDSAKKVVKTSEHSLSFDQLVLCTGTQPIHIPFGGNASDRVMGLHSLKDLGQLKAKIKPEERIAIVGAGLVGLELAFDLHHVGCQIELFDLGASPMSRAFPEAVGLHLKEKCSSMGMNVHMGNTILELNELEEAITCKMANGDDVIVDQIISVVGMKANSDLAKSTGMECDIGIKVDESGATSIPYIYAVGDCAQLGSQPKYFVAPLNRGAQRLVSSLLGKNEAPKEPALEAVKMKTDPYPIAFALPDVTPSGATWDVVEDDQGLKATLKSVTGDVLGYISAGKSFSMDIPIESSHLQKTEVVV